MPNQELPNSTQVRGGLATRQVVHNGSVSTRLTLQSLIGAVLNTVHIYTSTNRNIYRMIVTFIVCLTTVSIMNMCKSVPCLKLNSTISHGGMLAVIFAVRY